MISNYWVRPLIEVKGQQQFTQNRIMFEYTVKTMCKYSGFDFDTLMSTTRKSEVVMARKCVIHYLLQYSSVSLTQLGEWMGNRDHSTIIHNRDSANDMIDTKDRIFNKFYNEFKARL